MKDILLMVYGAACYAAGWSLAVYLKRRNRHADRLAGRLRDYGAALVDYLGECAARAGLAAAIVAGGCIGFAAASPLARHIIRAVRAIIQ